MGYAFCKERTVPGTTSAQLETFVSRALNRRADGWYKPSSLLPRAAIWKERRARHTTWCSKAGLQYKMINVPLADMGLQRGTLVTMVNAIINYNSNK